MGAKDCGESSTAVWQASLFEKVFLFGAILRCLEVGVIFVFYASKHTGGGLFEEGLEVRSSSCSFLIVESGLVGAFTIFVGLRALGLLVYSTIRITSSHLLVYVFFVLQLFVSCFGEVWFEFLILVLILVCGISRRSLWTEINFVYRGDSYLTQLTKDSLSTPAIRSP